MYESIKPPAPRKMETPPAETVVVIGDSFGEWLAYGLEQVFAETPQISIVRKVKSDLGLVRDVGLAKPEITWFDTPVVVDNQAGGTITKAT